jgi:hypothetical protein
MPDARCWMLVKNLAAWRIRYRSSSIEHPVSASHGMLLRTFTGGSSLMCSPLPPIAVTIPACR